MITGAALPGASDAEPQPVQATVTVDGQSYTAEEDVRAEVLFRGDYSATTEEEIAASRAQALTAAVASGLPLSTAVNLPTAQQVLMPLASDTYSLSDGFGASRPGRSHMGQDLAASVGTPIYAAVAGCVSLSTERNSGYGVSIRVESLLDGKTVSTLYSHLNNGTRAVKVGDCVTSGQYLGDVGSTGYIFGSCLHFEVHINGRPIDPRPWLSKNVD
ncbi:M23 family metallopeptidase [Microbacterium sp. OR21]|uniref:M23 family metallopeptidase n=1 Tax=Microbacterium sp. OR21 TaxID=3095346 RepID=UPI0039B370D2